ncbi:hypothetical protein ABQJ54_12560 [Rhodanobacter sp. Si-c]|uniref:Uncharacterized protein n=1 Tax=Rhodanobacter lycopersici TaxID=3162487 RepID=A0ABV3QFH7_9GAMM
MTVRHEHAWAMAARQRHSARRGLQQSIGKTRGDPHHHLRGTNMKALRCMALFVGLLGTGVALAATPRVDTAALVREALSAAPPAIAAGAAVIVPDGQGHPTVLHHGANGWTCLMTVSDPVRLPVCYDANGMAWREAIMAGHAPDPDRPGLSYMLQGGSAWSNIDPKADKLQPGMRTYIRIPPHVMILDAGTANATGLPSEQANPDTHKPFVMFGGTPYAILIIPVH